MVQFKRNIHKRIESLKSEIKELNTISNELSIQITEISGKGHQKILDAINRQRWFCFKDKPKIIFDKTTAYLWPNPQYWDLREYSTTEIKSMDFKNNFSDFFDNFDEWDIPTQNHCLNIEGFPVSNYWIFNTENPTQSVSLNFSNLSNVGYYKSISNSVTTQVLS